MKLKIYFTEEEIIHFLQNKGYIIESISSWNSQNEYHGKVSYVNVDIKIAYKERPNEKVLEGSSIDILSSYGLEEIFTQEIKKQLLNG